MSKKYALQCFQERVHRLIIFGCMLTLGMLSFTVFAGDDYVASDQDNTPLSPAVIQPLVPFDGKPVDLLPMSPHFRNYLNDVGNSKPNFFTTKTNIGTTGKVPVWVAYEVFGVTLDDSGAGGVVLRASLWGVNADNTKDEALLFSVMSASPNPVVLGQAIALRDFIAHPNQGWLSGNIKSVFGDQTFDIFMGRLTEGRANKKILIVRRYEVRGGQPLGVQVGFDKGDRFIPMAVRVSVGTNQADLDHLFVKGENGSYTYPSMVEPAWYKRHRSALALALLIAIAVAARAVISRRRWA